MLDMGFIDDIRRILALLPAAPPEPAVLRHAERRGAAARGRLPARARVRSTSRPRSRRPSRSTRSSTWSTPTASASCWPISSARGTSTRCSCSRAPSTWRRASPRSSIETASRRPPSTATGRQPERERALEAVQGGRGPGPRGDRRRGPRAGHRGPAAGRQLRAPVPRPGLRPPHRTDGPGGHARASPSRSSRSTRRSSSGRSTGCSSGTSPSARCAASSSTRPLPERPRTAEAMTAGAPPGAPAGRPRPDGPRGRPASPSFIGPRVPPDPDVSPLVAFRRLTRARAPGSARSRSSPTSRSCRLSSPSESSSRVTRSRTCAATSGSPHRSGTSRRTYERANARSCER